jgi:hypothetical protein
VRVDWLWTAGKYGSFLQTFPHLAEFSASSSSLRAVPVSLIVPGNPLPVLRGVFELDSVSDGRDWGHKTFLDTIACPLDCGNTPTV